MTSTHLLSRFVYMSNQNILALIFLSSLTCVLSKTTQVHEFLVKEKEKEWITIPTSPTLFDRVKITKVGNFTTESVKSPTSSLPSCKRVCERASKSVYGQTEMDRTKEAERRQTGAQTE